MSLSQDLPATNLILLDEKGKYVVVLTVLCLDREGAGQTLWAEVR